MSLRRSASLAIASAISLGVFNACASQEDGVGAISAALEAGMPSAGPALVRLNEISMNPPSSDGPYEFIELIGTPGGSLANYYVIGVDGDSATAGRIKYAFALGTACSGGACSIGANGLALIAAPDPVVDAAMPRMPHRPPSGSTTTVIYDSSLSNTNGSIENGAHTFMLIYAPSTTISTGTDWDALDGDGGMISTGDGIIDSDPSGILLVDAIATRGAGMGELVYGPVVSVASHALVRVNGNTTALSAEAWWGGQLGGSSSDSLELSTDSSKITSNTPTNALLTPGAPNFTASSTSDAGVADASSMTTSDAGATGSVDASLMTMADASTMTAGDASLMTSGDASTMGSTDASSMMSSDASMMGSFDASTSTTDAGVMMMPAVDASASGSDGSIAPRDASSAPFDATAFADASSITDAAPAPRDASSAAQDATVVRTDAATLRDASSDAALATQGDGGDEEEDDDGGCRVGRGARGDASVQSWALVLSAALLFCSRRRKRR